MTILVVTVKVILSYFSTINCLVPHGKPADHGWRGRPKGCRCRGGSGNAQQQQGILRRTIALGFDGGFSDHLVGSCCDLMGFNSQSTIIHRVFVLLVIGSFFQMRNPALGEYIENI